MEAQASFSLHVIVGHTSPFDSSCHLCCIHRGAFDAQAWYRCLEPSSQASDRDLPDALHARNRKGRSPAMVRGFNDVAVTSIVSSSETRW